MYGSNNPFRQHGRPNGQQVVDARSRSTTATEADQMPIVVKVQAVRALDQETSYFPRQADRFPSSSVNDHNIQHQDLLMTLERPNRPKNNLVTPMTSAGRVSNGKRVFRSLNGMPRSAVPDMAIAGVSKGTFVCSDTTQVNNIGIACQIDGLTSTRNTGQEMIYAGELVGVRAPPNRGEHGYQYSGTTKTGVIVPETFPLRQEMKEFSTYLDDATESFRAQIRSLAASSADDIMAALRNNPEFAGIRPNLFVTTLMFDPDGADLRADVSADVEQYRTAIKKDVRFLVDNAVAGTLFSSDDSKDVQTNEYRETIAFRALAIYFTWLRVSACASHTTNSPLAMLYEAEQQTYALMSLTLFIINQKRKIVLGVCTQLSPGNGGDLVVNMNANL